MFYNFIAINGHGIDQHFGPWHVAKSKGLMMMFVNELESCTKQFTFKA